MNQLIDAFKGALVAATNSAGELADTANFALKNVNWVDELNQPEPASNPVVEGYLETACRNSGQDRSSSRRVAKALLPVADQLTWHTRSAEDESDPDMAVFARKYTSTTVIGAGGLLSSDKVIAGFSLQGPDTYYPPHAHEAEESYWIIGGDGDWRVDAKPWFAVKPGDSVYHHSGARHAMQTNEQPMLSVWLWTSHLDSEVVIVRG